MLVELVVENFAVVERLRLPLHAGLNALTGETGSGKSLVVDAVSLLFGGRASIEMIRTGSTRAFVSGIFELPSDPPLRALLNGAGIETEDGELLIEREILANGKSRAYAASRPVTAAFLKELAPFLGDIHGQHDQQKLFSTEAQRELLDDAAATAPPADTDAGGNSTAPIDTANSPAAASRAANSVAPLTAADSTSPLAPSTSSAAAKSVAPRTAANSAASLTAANSTAPLAPSTSPAAAKSVAPFTAADSAASLTAADSAAPLTAPQPTPQLAAANSTSPLAPSTSPAAPPSALLAEVAAAYHAWHSLVRQLAELNHMEQETLRLADLWDMQRKEIEALELSPAQDEKLENEKRVLRNVARLSEAATIAYDALSEAEPSVATGLGVALKKLEELCRIDESLTGLLETLKPAQIAVSEATHELRHYLGNLEADPHRLEEVENRLAQIEKLKRKYGTSIDEILAFLQQVKAQLSAVETAGERRAELETEITHREAAFRETAQKLRAVRKNVAKRLEKQVETELAGLAMPGTIFRIVVTDAAPTAHGVDAVEFLVSANIGEQPRPLDKVASGGELSRIALALKVCVGQTSWSGAARHVPRTLIFDEVDAGISAAAGEMVGRRLKQISEISQVLCVTHLAQIAGFADAHYSVAKRESQGRTVAEVEHLQGPERVREIGRMLSGQRLTDEALRHAEKLIEEYERRA